MAVYNLADYGSTLSVRSFMRMGSHTDIRVVHKLSISSTQTYIKWDPFKEKLEFYHPEGGGGTGSVSNLKLTSTGGTLHGLWNMDADGANMEAGFSDRSLKTNIRPLFETLHDAEQPPAAEKPRQGAGKAGWTLDSIIQKLRPVSFSLRGDKGKHTRLGFIADEIFDVLPQVHRISPGGDRKQGIMYQDLIAFLTNMLQELFTELSAASSQLKSVEERIHQRKSWGQVQGRKGSQ